MNREADQVPHRSDVEDFRQAFAELEAQIGKVIVGHHPVVRGVLIALFVGGHVLLEGVPGLGKTLLVRTLAQVLGLKFKRIQCTPDLMPADILGTQLIVERGGAKTFEFAHGPIFTQLLLADEINRATPKTQSALLEAMAESCVTVAGTTYEMERPFCVLATQNPIEMEGTYPLPEAQLDRFLLKVLVPYPSFDELNAILQRTTTAARPLAEPVWPPDEAVDRVMRYRQLVREVLVSRPVEEYVMRLVMATHPNGEAAHEWAQRYVAYGASPRGAQALILGAKVLALIDGRVNASFEDVDWMAGPALNHRILLNFEAETERLTTMDVVTRVRDDVRRTIEEAAVRA